jgi:hypothetical protein
VDQTRSAPLALLLALPPTILYDASASEYANGVSDAMACDNHDDMMCR